MPAGTTKDVGWLDEELLGWFEHKAAQTGGKLSPTIAMAARNWMLWEDAARLAEADQRTGHNPDHRIDCQRRQSTQHCANAVHPAGPLGCQLDRMVQTA